MTDPALIVYDFQSSSMIDCGNVEHANNSYGHYGQSYGNYSGVTIMATDMKVTDNYTMITAMIMITATHKKRTVSNNGYADYNMYNDFPCARNGYHF